MMSPRELQLTREAVACINDITALLAEPNSESLKSALQATEKLQHILPKVLESHKESIENESG